MAGIATYSRPTRSILLATASHSITSGGALVEAAPPAVHAGRLRLRYYGKSAPKRLGFEAPTEQPRVSALGWCALTGGHVGRRQAAQAGYTISYDVLGLSNAQEKPYVPPCSCTLLKV